LFMRMASRTHAYFVMMTLMRKLMMTLIRTLMKTLMETLMRSRWSAFKDFGCQRDINKRLETSNRYFPKEWIWRRKSWFQDTSRIYRIMIWIHWVWDASTDKHFQNLRLDGKWIGLRTQSSYSINFFNFI
jgi:hypothetical protein